jgi:hypothetical protein
MPYDEKLPQGIIRNKEGEVVILLPAGPIRSTVTGESGTIYDQTLHDDPTLGRPTAKIEPTHHVG